MEIKNEDGMVLYVDDGGLCEVMEAAVRSGTNLCKAHLYKVDLHRVDLHGAKLLRANLRRSNLRGANLRGADLCKASLRKANLYGAFLYGADLTGADLRGVDLCGADLSRTHLRGVKLLGARLNWNSPWLLGHILWEAAGDDLQRKRHAAYVMHAGDCWKHYVELIKTDEVIEWGFRELAKWIVPNDSHPFVLDPYIEITEVVNAAHVPDLVDEAESNQGLTRKQMDYILRECCVAMLKCANNPVETAGGE